jgi:hypothetical protein
MASINFYNISDIYWYPIDFNIVGNQFTLNKTPITFSNGMSFNIFDGLENLKDFTINQKTGMVLTNLKNNNDLFSDDNIPNLTNNLSMIQSPLGNTSGNIYSIKNNQLYNKGNKSFTLSDKVILNFENNLVSLKFSNNLVLTYQGVNNPVILKTQIEPPDYNNQFFDYILGNNCIALFKSNDKTISIKDNNDLLYAIENNDLSNIPFIFTLPSYTSRNIVNSSVKDSFLVKYDSNPLTNQKNIFVNEINSNYQQNYLGIFPIEYVSIKDSTAYCDFYIHALKNYQTTEFDYGQNKLNRVYTRIFSGTNQNKGLDRIHLGYQTSSIKMEFPPDINVPFYFTPTSDTVLINEAGFIEDGATASNNPYTSDRLFTSTVNKFQDIVGFNTKEYTNSNNNLYLCSWLSGTTNGDKVWMDRYYNPAYYSMDQALSATFLVYNSKYYNTNSYIFDIPSQAKLNAATLYYYHHVGKNDYSVSVKLLNYSLSSNNNIVFSNVLNITSFSPLTSVSLIDYSTFNNNGLYYETNNDNFKNTYWNLDGNNYGILPADNSLLERNKITTSLWLKVQDWSNIQGYQIIGNYYNSGFGLIYDSNSISPIFSVINQSSGKLYNFNYRFGQLSKIQLPENSYDFVQKLNDMSYWVFDSQNLYAIKYDVDGQILVPNKKFAGISKISQIETDSNENLYIYDNNIKKYIIMNQYGNISGTYSVPNTTNRIEIDLNDKIQYVQGNASVIDNSNNLWQVIGFNLYNGSYLFATVGETKQIICDNNNNIWLISNNDSYSKIDNYGNLVFTYNFSKSILPDATNCPPPPPIVTPSLDLLEEDLPFISTDVPEYITTDNLEDILVNKPTTVSTVQELPNSVRIRIAAMISVPVKTETCSLSSYQQQDQLILIDETDNEAYMIDQNGQPITKLNFQALLGANESLNFIINGDFTGYQNTRKYRKNKNKNLSWNFKTSDGELNSLTYDVSNLPEGWHHFVFSYDSTTGLGKYYIDSKLVDSISKSSNTTIEYEYDTSILIASRSVKNTNLNDFIGITDGYRFIGSIADIKMYNITLTQNDVEQLYFYSEFSPKISSLKWNMPVGVRNYVEEIKHWYQFQMPGSKSKYYNINIHNLNVSDNLKNNIQLAINNILSKISPTHTSLYKINWK